MMKLLKIICWNIEDTSIEYDARKGHLILFQKVQLEKRLTEDYLYLFGIRDYSKYIVCNGDYLIDKNGTRFNILDYTK